MSNVLISRLTQVLLAKARRRRFRRCETELSIQRKVQNMAEDQCQQRSMARGSMTSCCRKTIELVVLKLQLGKHMCSKSSSCYNQMISTQFLSLNQSLPLPGGFLIPAWASVHLSLSGQRMLTLSVRHCTSTSSLPSSSSEDGAGGGGTRWAG